MTNNDITSRILNTVNSLSKDDHIPRRYVLHLARKKSEFLIAQKLGERSLHRDANIYTPIDCYELESIDVVSCPIVEFRRCKSIMKGVKKLPKLIYSRSGSSLKEVTSIDGENEFKETTPAQYRRDKNRGESDYIYYFIKDDYPYFLDTEVQMVNLYLITTETEKICEISSCGGEDCCKSLWEYDFIVPDKLEEIVIGEVLKEISMSKNIPLDENPNLNNNEK